jgi:hypothetical protein
MSAAHANILGCQFNCCIRRVDYSVTNGLVNTKITLRSKCSKLITSPSRKNGAICIVSTFEVSIADLCRKEGINQNLYYRWSKEFHEAGKKRLAGDTVREDLRGCSNSLYQSSQ